MKLFLFLLLLLSNTWANDGEKLAKQKACLGCHSIQHIGISYPPAFIKIAEKQEKDPATIQNTIRYGKGKMPAHPTLTDAEILILTNWILSLGEKK